MKEHKVRTIYVDPAYHAYYQASHLAKLIETEGRIHEGEILQQQLELLKLEKEEIEKSLLAESDGLFHIQNFLGMIKYHSAQILALASDRWVGIEGIMAVTDIEIREKKLLWRR